MPDAHRSDATVANRARPAKASPSGAIAFVTGCIIIGAAYYAACSNPSMLQYYYNDGEPIEVLPHRTAALANLPHGCRPPQPAVQADGDTPSPPYIARTKD